MLAVLTSQASECVEPLGVLLDLLTMCSRHHQHRAPCALRQVSKEGCPHSFTTPCAVNCQAPEGCAHRVALSADLPHLQARCRQRSGKERRACGIPCCGATRSGRCTRCCVVAARSTATSSSRCHRDGLLLLHFGFFIFNLAQQHKAFRNIRSTTQGICMCSMLRGGGHINDDVIFEVRFLRSTMSRGSLKEASCHVCSVGHLGCNIASHTGGLQALRY